MKENARIFAQFIRETMSSPSKYASPLELCDQAKVSFFLDPIINNKVRSILDLILQDYATVSSQQTESNAHGVRTLSHLSSASTRKTH